MQHYKAITDLLNDWENIPVPGRVYIQATKSSDLENAEFWTMSSNEQKNQNFIKTEYGEVPEALADFKVESLLDSQTFQDIIENKFDHNPNLSLSQTDKFVEAINYYLKEDDFLD